MHMNTLSIIQDNDQQSFVRGVEDCACSNFQVIERDHIESSVNITGQSMRQVLFTPITETYFLLSSPYSIKGSILINRELYNLINYDPVNIETVPQELIEILRSYGIMGEPDINIGAIPPKTLEVWLQITDQCNLNCSYCFVKQSNEKMSYQTAAHSIKTLFKSARNKGFKKIRLKFAGGEPTLCFSLVERVQQLALRTSVEEDIELESILLTNGTMISPEIVNEIEKLHMRVMVSIDGIDINHDQQRYYKNGARSFDRVSRGLDLLLKMSHPPFVSITVTKRNLLGLKLLTEWLLSKGISFNLNLQRDSSYNIAHLDEYEKEVIDAINDVLLVVENRLPENSILDGIFDRTNLRFAHSYTCGAGESYVVINTKGGINTCHMKYDQPMGWLMDNTDPLQVIKSNQSHEMFPNVIDKIECSTCDWRYWCSGGCPIHTYTIKGSYKLKSPYCNIYKAIFPKMLRLEGLRLLKHKSEEVFIAFKKGKTL